MTEEAQLGDATRLVESRLREHLSVIESFVDQSDTIASIAATVTRVLGAGGKVLIFGNGGSAADAQHFAGELVGRLYLERRALPVIALSTNTSNMTAISNDFGFDSVFSRQVEALGTTGDLAIGISTSGNSPNVVKALEVARNAGLGTIGMTGRGGGVMGDSTDMCLSVETDDTPRCQEAHISAIHIICELIEKDLAAT